MVESERALRALGVFRNVALDTTRVDRRLAVRVTTADGWSTRPQVGFSSAAGDVSWDAGLVEKNLLGTAMQVMAEYRQTPDRSLTTLFWQAPGLLFRRARLRAAYQDLSDGAFGSWSYGVPFYETSAPWSVETGGGAGTLRVLRFRDGLLADSVQRRSVQVGVFRRLHGRPVGGDRAGSCGFRPMTQRPVEPVSTVAPPRPARCPAAFS